MVPSALSRRPTCTAASPPIPASTSSNTSVGSRSDSAPAVRIASMTRESSPPDATRASGAGASPGLAENRISTSSAPSAPISGRGLRRASNSAPSSRSPPSSDVTARLSRGGLERRPRAVHVESSVLQGGREVGGLPHLALQPVALPDRGLDRAAVLALGLLQHGQPGLDRLQPGRVRVHGLEVAAQLGARVGQLGVERF